MRELLINFLSAMKAKSNLLWQQSIRITKYAILISDFIDIDNLTIHRLFVSSLLSNIGMIGIPKQIQTKKEAFTAEEFNIYKTHPSVGKKILSPIHDFKDDVINVIMHHHENYDGTGYPEGLKGKEIPFESRLIRIIESFDYELIRFSSASDKGIQESKKEILNKAGVYFDPELVNIFGNFIDKAGEDIKRIISLKEDIYLSRIQEEILKKIDEMEEKSTAPK